MRNIGKSLIFRGEDTYDVDGNRTSKTVGDEKTEYVLNGSQILSMKKGKERLDFLYDENSSLMGLEYNGTRYYYIRNAQLDIIGIIDRTGKQVVSNQYDAWGKVLPTTGELKWTVGVANPFRYRGYYYDQESGLYYLQSRYYDPVVGRFISADTSSVLTASPMSLTDKNLFSYCDNNPVIRIDRGGEFWNVLIGAVVGAVVGVAGQLVSDLTTSFISGEWTISNWQTYAGAFAGGAVGGAILGGTGNVALANTASGYATTGIGLSLEKVTGATDKSWGEIAINAAADGAISYGLGKLPGVKKVTKGRNSMSAVYKSGLTKLRNHTALRMSKKL